MSATRIAVVDSHTGGEPTRLVIGGAPSLHGTLAERVHQLRDRHDRFRCAVVNEPRGSDVLVGALLTPPADQTCVAGAIFFNNVGYLGMCGHGTIGLMVTLAWLGRIVPGEHRVETPVGRVVTHLHDAHTVSVRNVPAYRFAHGVSVHVEGHGFVKGDVAWGGNWFFLTDQHGQRLALDNAGRLADFTLRVRAALTREGICGADGRRDRRGLRPLALRHGHEREAGVPLRRWRIAARRKLAAGEHHRQRIRRPLRTGRRLGAADDPRQCVGHR